MRPGSRFLQAAGIVAFVVAAFLPAFVSRLQPRNSPRGRALPPRAVEVRAAARVPAEDLGMAFLRTLDGEGSGGLWDHRTWYPFLLAPFWLGGLLLVAGAGGAARRRGVGLALLGLSVGIAVLEAFYLGTEYLPFLTGVAGRIELVLAWVAVVAVLFLRRRGARSVSAVEATIAAQALLGVLHLLTLPSSQVRVWLSAFPLGEALAAVGTNFLPGFWIALAGLAVAALPAYVRGGQGFQSPSTKSNWSPSPSKSRTSSTSLRK